MQISSLKNLFLNVNKEKISWIQVKNIFKKAV